MKSRNTKKAIASDANSIDQITEYMKAYHFDSASSLLSDWKNELTNGIVDDCLATSTENNRIIFNELIDTSGLTIYAIAKKMGIAATSIYERTKVGKTPVTVEFLNRIAVAIGKQVVLTIENLE